MHQIHVMRILIIALLTTFSTLAFANKNVLRFNGYGTNDGISVGKVHKVFQDSRGFIWIATEDGLNLFDGYNFRVFRSISKDSTSLTGNKIFDVVEDSNQNLWIATSNGLNKYDLVSGIFSSYALTTDAQSTAQSEIRSLYICNDTILLIGTHKQGLLKTNFKTQQTQKIALPGNPDFIRKITCIDDHYYIGTHGFGFYEMNKTSGKIKQFKPDANNKSTYSNQVNTVLKHNETSYWVATENGIYEYNKTNGINKEITPVHLFKHTNEVIRVGDLIEDKDHVVWAATSLGLLRYQNNQWKLYTANNEQLSLRSNWLVDLFEDESGSIWISNRENGVNIIHNKTQKFIHYNAAEANNSLSDNLVFSFDKYDTNEVLVGTIGGGLDYFIVSEERFHNYNKSHPAISNRITAIHTIDYKNIWLGTWGNGLQHFNPETGAVKSYTASAKLGAISNNTIVCIEPAQNNALWIGTFDGLNLLNLHTKQFTTYKNLPGLNSNTIFFIYNDKNDTLWLGTRGGGLCALNTKTMQAQSWVNNPTDTTSIANNVVKFIYKDHNENLWLATEMGISRFDKKSGTFSNYDVSSGLPNNNIWAILPDNENNLWVSTNSGIAKIILSEQSKVTDIKTYGKNQGLLSLEFSQGAYLRDPATGMLYFGGTEGFYMFNPKEIKPRQYNPPIHITSIKVMDKEFKSDTLPPSLKQLTIPWNKNFLAFEFVGLDYTHQGNILYQYKMEGQSNQWSPPSERTFASFPDLKDGQYRFMVKTSNSEGVWNEERYAILHITVTPPWWRTTIAYLLYFIIPILSVLLYIRIRTKKLQHEKEVLEKVVADRTAELVKKNLDITSSIQYAQRIQQAIILPSMSAFYEDFKKSFILFRPKDIVSGDFFWYGKKGTTRVFTAADCTGHGVPGAFMSIIGNNSLNQIVIEQGVTEPAKILTILDEKIKESLHQKGRKSDTFDGMDIAICSIDENSNKLTFAGAYNPLYLVRNNELIKHKAVRRSIGGSQLKQSKSFESETIELQKNDTIYIFSDGYADQFGGADNRKFTTKRMQEKLVEIQNKNMPNQQMILEETIENWMNGFEQIDDMIVVGVRF